MAEDKDPQVMYCYVHPDRETLLRCNRCERPICQSCAVLTPTGYRCKECVRGQQKIFEPRVGGITRWLLSPRVCSLTWAAWLPGFSDFSPSSLPQWQV